MSKHLNYKAAILDLDGVITKTARLHAKAWKKLFDAYNEERKKKNRKSFVPFSIEKDYPAHIDGLPRYSGVSNFLQSRNIELPQGKITDSEKTETVRGLGNRKNTFFQKILEEEGVEVYEDTMEKVREWKDQGMKVAVISSSKNCLPVLQAAGLDVLFDVRVDGVVAEERELEGKPEPDVFLEAARNLGVSPNSCIVLEDAIGGVEAAVKAGIGYVIGIDRTGVKEDMKAKGAHEVVNTAADISFNKDENDKNGEGEARHLPDALKEIDAMLERFHNELPVVFLDFDGTLADITNDPDDAGLDKGMRTALDNLNDLLPYTAIVSGRDRADVAEKVKLEGMYYAGSHGFDISGPDGFHDHLEAANEMLPDLDEAEKNLNEALKDVEGAQVERKKYAIAIHYRNVAKQNHDKVKEAVEQEGAAHKKLKVSGGKMIYEMKPDVDWDKGKAVLWLLDRFGVDTEKTPVVYLGDDVTDEDAFRVLKGKGIGIMVGEKPGETAAEYRLENTAEVEEWLTRLASRFRKAEAGI